MRLSSLLILTVVIPSLSAIADLYPSMVGGKSFGFVGIDIECKNISISGDIGGFILSTK